MTAPTTLERFAAAVTLAVGLPHPTVIYRAILTSSDDVDDGLRAASYDGDGRGGTSSSHPERMLAKRNPHMFPRDDQDATRAAVRPRNERDDLIRLNRSTTAVLDAVAALNAECCDAGQPETWEEAIHHANLLEQQGYLAAAIDVGRNVDSWAMRFVHAIDTVRAVRDSWMAHAPAQGLAEANFAWCHSHARLNLKEKRTSRRLCTWCWRHVQDLAEFSDHAAVVLQEQDDNWPSVEMIRAKQDQRRVLYDKEHALWLRAHGIDPTAAHQRRQHRRTA